MKKLTITLIVLFATLNLFAQNKPGNITGKVTDASGQNVTDATISLFKVDDSSLVKISLSDKEGKFSFENILSGQYYLTASSVGYAKIKSAIIHVNGESTVNAGILKMEKNATTLKGVVISASKPFIERKIDRTVINVDASITNAGTTALEVLEKSPGVSVDKDGNVSLKGKSGVTIMLDGRPSYLSGQELANLLKNMSSSNIDQIEIMTNPPAKFDASGNSGVINIKTKKNKMRGMNGSITAGIAQSKLTRTNNSLNLNYRDEKLNVFGNYSYSLWQSERETHIERRFRNASHEIETIFNQRSESESFSQNHSIKAGIDFFAN
ncbi:MAG: TonB-dependent receptor, partial [Ginsengibacter sp.]